MRRALKVVLLAGLFAATLAPASAHRTPGYHATFVDRARGVLVTGTLSVPGPNLKVGTFLVRQDFGYASGGLSVLPNPTVGRTQTYVTGTGAIEAAPPDFHGCTVVVDPAPEPGQLPLDFGCFPVEPATLLLEPGYGTPAGGVVGTTLKSVRVTQNVPSLFAPGYLTTILDIEGINDPQRFGASAQPDGGVVPPTPKPPPSASLPVAGGATLETMVKQPGRILEGFVRSNVGGGFFASTNVVMLYDGFADFEWWTFLEKFVLNTTNFKASDFERAFTSGIRTQVDTDCIIGDRSLVTAISPDGCVLH